MISDVLQDNFHSCKKCQWVLSMDCIEFMDHFEYKFIFIWRIVLLFLWKWISHLTHLCHHQREDNSDLACTNS